jgi:hypothetical protein
MYHFSSDDLSVLVIQYYVFTVLLKESDHLPYDFRILRSKMGVLLYLHTIFSTLYSAMENC